MFRYLLLLSKIYRQDLNIMYGLGYYGFSEVPNYLKLVPAIKPEYLSEVQNSLQGKGLIAIFEGPLKTIPYKVYAFYSGELKLNLFTFVLISIPARGIRYFLVTLLSGFFFGRVLKRTHLRTKQLILLSTWIIFYIFFFTR